MKTGECTMAIDDIKSKFETLESDNGLKARQGINSGNENKCLVGFKRFLRTSRFSGLPFAVVYGLFIYFYVTYLILSDPATSPKSVSESAINSSRYAHALPFELNTLADDQSLSVYLWIPAWRKTRGSFKAQMERQ